MPYWICVTCGTQFAPASEQPPARCRICEDERQYIGPNGQQWTTLEQIKSDGYQNDVKEQETNLWGIGIQPVFALGQRALLVKTSQGNILWDCPNFLDEKTIDFIHQQGGLKAISISHPHYYATMVEGSERLQAPVYLHEANREWVMRPDKSIIFWSDDSYRLTDDVLLLRLGGHFPGSMVLHWSQGANGQGALLTGDTIHVAADHNWVSFMYSYPNMIPLSARQIQKMVRVLDPYTFDRLYGAWFDRVVRTDAKAAVLRSAKRYVQALEGYFDN